MLKIPISSRIRTLAAGSARHVRASHLAAASLILLMVLTITILPASASSPMGYWSFDQSGGTSVADLSGNENNGTLINGPVWSAGKFGYGLSFNGVDQYIEIAHSDSLNMTKELTLTAWIHNQAEANSLLVDPEYHIIASKGWAPDSGGSWTLAWDKAANDIVFCARRSSNKGYNCVFFNFAALSNDWHHLSALFNHGKITLYVDGSLVAGPVSLGSTTLMSNSENVRIGAVLENANKFLQNWHGSIDEVQIYSKALSDAEIKALYKKSIPETSSGSTMTSSGSLSQTNTATAASSEKAPIATPVITPNGGTFTHPVSVVLTSSTPGAFIYYTTNGSAPTQSSTLYKGPFTLASNTVVKAAAFKNNSTPSSEASAWFGMDGQFDFSLSNSGDKAAKRGSSTQNNISAALKSGNTKPIAYSLSGLPTGANSSFSTSSCNPACSTVLTLSTSTSTPAGTFPIVVSGSDGIISRSTSFNLTVSDLPTVATPTINPNGGSYTGSVPVAITTSTTGALIYYTTDGSTPTQSSIPYGGAVTVTNNTILKAAAFMSGFNPSAVASASFTINQPTVATPTITPNGGSYTGSVSVSMQTATTGAAIYYTTDGTAPTQSSVPYSGAVTLKNSATIKAAAFKTGYNPSGVVSAPFTVTQPFDFSLNNANNGNQSVLVGSITRNTITATLASGAPQAVTFSASGLPSGTTASFSSSSCSPTCSSVLTLNISNSTAAGTYSIVVTGSGGGVVRTTGFNLTVASTAPSVSVNKTSYTSGETITVTINRGAGNVQEWIALYGAFNPDSTYSFEGNWQYLNGQQIAPAIAVPYPVTLSFAAPFTSGTYNIRYFAFNGISNRLAASQSFTVTAPTITTTGNLKYVSPNGSGTTCSAASPCAISQIGVAATPGDTWVLKNGLYYGSGSVLFINGINGTSSSRIRVTAENPGGAILQGDGTSGHVLRVINASYWDFDNLVVRNRDNPNNTGSNASIIGTYNSNFMTFKKMVAADNNTYGNNDAVLLQGNNILFEDSDILRSHRNFLACYPATSSNITIRRVYVGQPVADHSNSGPGDGFVFYSCRDSINENSIAEGLDGYGFTGWGNNNAIRGAIAMNNNGGLFNGTASSTADQGQNFTLTGYVGVANNGTCAYFRPAGNYVVEGVTCIGNQVMADNSITNGSSSFGVTIRNAMVKDVSHSGFYLGQSNGSFTTKLVEYSEAWNTGGINGGWTLNNTPPGPGDVDPGIGSCMVYVPDTSAYKGRGKGGADVGANVIYAYQDGALTSNKLWNSSTGKMRYGPPVVAGVNDSSTGFVRDTVGSRLNITTSGCLPAGY
jgi:hypothetical protein